MSDRPGKGTGCVVLLLFSFFVVWAMMPEPHGPVAPAKASYVISDLREMRTAAWALFADSADEVGRWTALPDGITSVDAPFALFWKYVDDYTKYEDRGPSWRSPPDWGRPCGCAPMSYPKGPFFSLEIVSADDDVLWRAGAIVSNDGPLDAEVRERLEGKAKPVELLDARGEPYTKEDEIVYMVWSLGEMARNREQVLENRAELVHTWLALVRNAAFRYWSTHRDRPIQQDTISRGRILGIAGKYHYIGPGPHRFAERETEEGTIWMVGHVVPHRTPDMTARLASRGLLDEDGAPYSGGEVVWLRWSVAEMGSYREATGVIEELGEMRERASKLLTVSTDEADEGPSRELTSRDVGGGTLWLVGRWTENAKARDFLAAWASRWGLVDEVGEPYTGGEDVYMVVSLDAGAR
ncbi:MAG: hypothetical protein IJR14_10095 [Synergistaceae bacterium]|nr:hypothetical protein [Synergistaceae bacterium]